MNNNTIPTSPTQWMEMPYDYQQRDFGLANSPYENFSHRDSTLMTTTTPPNYTTYPISHVTSSDYHYSNLSPDNSSGNGDHPKTSSASKPVRRRPRASKKTPTTLVNASISNFRAVVQQYTGCPIKNQKGPINLSFGQQTDHDGNETSQYGYSHEEAASNLQAYNSQDMNGSPAGYGNSGTSMSGVEGYGCQ